ncbi:MAG: undecaprenyl-diphosphate phosphatase [Alphaproteobacteria bacterium]
MAIWNIIVFSIIQGVTEFLPISSTAHLQLIGKIMDVQPSPTLEIAVHFGTIFAVMIYFREDIKSLTISFWDIIRGKSNEDKDLLIKLIIATIPIVIIGGALTVFVGDLSFRNSLKVIGWTTLIFGLLLQLADKIGLTIRRVEHMSYMSVFIIGICQAIAIIPGVSRSGITITIMRFLGMERSEAARFSMLMSIPVILIAGIKTGADLAVSGDAQLTISALLAAVLSFIFALIVIAALMSWVRKSTFFPFVVYRVALAVVILLVAYNVI